MRRLAFLLPLIFVACSHHGTTTSSTGDMSSTTTGGMGGNGGASSTTVSTTSGFTTSSTTSASTSSASTGTNMTAAPGMDLVNAGSVCKSTHYTMVMTFGQSTQNQSITTSPNYKMHGGVIGSAN